MLPLVGEIRAETQRSAPTGRAPLINPKRNYSDIAKLCGIYSIHGRFSGIAGMLVLAPLLQRDCQFPADQLAEVAADLLTKLALQLLANNAVDEASQPLLVQDRRLW